MNSCLYINKHLHMLNDIRKDAYNYNKIVKSKNGKKFLYITFIIIYMIIVILLFIIKFYPKKH